MQLRGPPELREANARMRLRCIAQQRLRLRLCKQAIAYISIFALRAIASTMRTACLNYANSLPFRLHAHILPYSSRAAQLRIILPTCEVHAQMEAAS